MELACKGTPSEAIEKTDNPCRVARTKENVFQC
jgi:hypothetical protein